MRYTDNELEQIFNESKNGILSFKELEPIKNQLRIITNKIEFDAIDFMELIEILEYFNELNILDKINEDSINFLCKICLGNENEIISVENTAYFNNYIKNLLLSHNLNRCDYDYNLPSFLMEFDIFFDLIRNNCDLEDIDSFKKYNKDLSEIVKRYLNCINEYQTSSFYQTSSTSERVMMLSVLDHLAVIVYLYLSDYQYNYDLLNETFYDIINNYIDFMYSCSQRGLYKDIFDTVNYDKTIDEYVILQEIIKNKINPPISGKKYIK